MNLRRTFGGGPFGRNPDIEMLGASADLLKLSLEVSLGVQDSRFNFRFPHVGVILMSALREARNLFAAL